MAVGNRPRIVDYHKKKKKVIMDADRICLSGKGPPMTNHNKFHHNMCCCELSSMQGDWHSPYRRSLFMYHPKDEFTFDLSSTTNEHPFVEFVHHRRETRSYFYI